MGEEVSLLMRLMWMSLKGVSWYGQNLGVTEGVSEMVSSLISGAFGVRCWR